MAELYKVFVAIIKSVKNSLDDEGHTYSISHFVNGKKKQKKIFKNEYENYSKSSYLRKYKILFLFRIRT